MDSDDDVFDKTGSGNAFSGDDDSSSEEDMDGTKKRKTESSHEVLTTEEIVQHMIDCIKEVNTVVEVSPVECLKSARIEREKWN